MIVSFAALALAVLAVPIVNYASGPSGVLEACINPGNGGMRLVDAATPCHNNETRVQWNVTGPQGPEGPQGPPGDSAASGPPYVWVCTPARFPPSASNTRADVYVFNGGSSPATVSVTIFDQNGNDLTGAPIPGAGINYPGVTNTAVAPNATLNLTWQTAAENLPGSVMYSVRVTSTDQPIVVGADFQWSGFQQRQCSPLPR